MRAIALAFACALFALPLRAEGLERLMQALRFDDTVEIMQREGQLYGAQVGQDMLAGSERESWARMVARVYQAEEMGRILRARFAEEMAGVDPAPLTAFFEGLGAEVLALELATRRAFLEPGTEAVAAAGYQRLVAEDAPLVPQIEAIIADSDLVERNVAGVMNSNLAFYRGVAQGGGLGLGEGDMLADLWAQEDELRTETRDWLHGFMAMPYAPVDRADLEEYIALWRDPGGRALNQALFVAFDAMHEANSYELGRAVAMQMQGEDL
ncbi:hypothetical protein SAMN04488077_1304 [Roseovarius tolerans]|uniref:DUF2059 domain-containing protein n=1 Tax=Roseovarius tolerans TaxID=74031 RepID=A0A1H8JCC9_9RHOB|nr:hypothetical protein [Roseovarius tolerans]SEN78460.1 hypothetical protein SAMN04488077_1304 [Roseovarius tolerans]